MTYFNYHAKAKKLIAEGHCTHAEVVDSHNGISPALLLHFDNHLSMPIRQEKWEAYFDLLAKQNIPIVEGK